MTRTRIVLLPTLALAALLQVGCNATTPVREAPAAPAPKPDEAALRHQRIAAEELSPHDRVTRALELFQSGHPKDAREHLSIALAQRPRYRLAKQLLDQFDVDPQKMLGKESFEYKVKPGESLSLIAERYLGDPLDFIILARYNQLSEPGRLAAGQTLRIPSRYKPKPVAVTPAGSETQVSAPAAEPAAPPPSAAEAQPPTAAGAPAEAPAGDLYAAAAALREKGDNAGVIARLEPAMDTAAGQDPRLRKLLASAYAAQGKSQAAAKDWTAARASLMRATDLNPDDHDSVSRLTEVEDKIEGRRLFAIGQAQAVQGQAEKAFQSYKDATVYDPKNPDYRKALHATAKKLAERYHRSALEHYHREQLEAAKADWTKVLTFEPDNRIAQGYLAKVEELQKRLREVEGQH